MDNKNNSCLIRTVFRVSLLMGGFAGSIIMLFLLMCSLVFAKSFESAVSFVPTEFTFPFVVEGTHIQVLSFMSYEGPYLEDGSMDDVANTLAIVIRNTSHQDIRKASITVKTADDTLHFSAEYIPAGKKLMILEHDRAQYTRQIPVEITGWEQPCRKQGIETVQIIQMDLGTVLVKNTSDTLLQKICLYHKNYLPECDIYVGGAVYETSIAYLLPGESVQIQPVQYAAGYSKMVRIESNT